MIGSFRGLGLGLALGMTLGSASPLSAQSSSTLSPALTPTVAQTIVQATPVRSSLSLGSQGADVTELQSILQLLGFYIGRIDGVFSEATQQGVQRFQQAAGLPATGQMTPVDWNRLLPSATVQTAQAIPALATIAPQPVSSPTAQSFPIPEAASQPPSGSVAPPSLPAADPPSSARPPQPAPEAPSTSPAPEDSPDSETITVPVLRQGSEGADVERLQERLAALGFYSGEIDGIFGEGTEEAVKDFQEEYDLEIDGIVGSTTWETLFNTP